MGLTAQNIDSAWLIRKFLQNKDLACEFKLLAALRLKRSSDDRVVKFCGCGRAGRFLSIFNGGF
jgi:hypothetical protein